MTERYVYARQTKARLLSRMRQLPNAVCHSNDVLRRVGLAMLKRIRQAFVTKSRGGTDAAGDRWAPLKRKKRKRTLGILRDTGELLRSLTPNSGSRYQVFRVTGKSVTVGTTRPGAMAHHRGAPRRNLPQRRLWPPTHRWPDSWWKDIKEQVRLGLLDEAARLARGS